MAAKSKKPEIRFAGFEDEWELKKIEELAVLNPKSQLPEVFKYIDLESVVGTEMISYREEVRETAPSRAQRLAKQGDLFYQTVRPYQKNNYLFQKSDQDYVFSTGYTQMRPNCNGDFLISLVQNNQFLKYVLAMCTGTSYPSINANDLAEIQIFVPKKAHEQAKIGEHLSSLDTMITLEAAKHEKLVTIKKAMLEKLFPQGDSDTPELRFGGFTEPWEQRKLGDCFFERTESMPNGELISVTTNNGVKKFSELGRHDNSNDNKEKYKKVCIGDIAYNSMRMWQGASGYSPYEGIVSPAYTVLAPNEGVNSKCVAYLFKRPDTVQIFRRNSQGITSDNWNLKYPALSEIKIMLPIDTDEQSEIANYLQYLDDLVVLQQQKVQKLKNIKFACMEKMFV